MIQTIIEYAMALVILCAIALGGLSALVQLTLSQQAQSELDEWRRMHLKKYEKYLNYVAGSVCVVFILLLILK